MKGDSYTNHVFGPDSFGKDTLVDIDATHMDAINSLNKDSANIGLVSTSNGLGGHFSHQVYKKGIYQYKLNED